MKVNLEEIKFDDAGLIPAIVQDVHTREVLTLAYMNSESLSLTLETGQTWFWSRSRQQLWKKGETSGNTQEVVEIKVDCDNDALVLLVNPAGPACHTGATSCFHNSAEDAREGSRVNKSSANTLSDLYELIARRKQERPDGSYTTYLFDEGLDTFRRRSAGLGCDVTPHLDSGHIVLTQVDATSPYGVLLVGYLLFGISLGLVYAPMSTAAMAAMPGEKVGIASGVLAMDRVLAGAVSLAATGAAFHALLGDGHSFANSIAGSTWVPLALCAVGAILTWAFVRDTGDSSPGEPQHHMHHRRFHL